MANGLEMDVHRMLTEVRRQELLLEIMEVFEEEGLRGGAAFDGERVRDFFQRIKVWKEKYAELMHTEGVSWR